MIIQGDVCLKSSVICFDELLSVSYERIKNKI